MQFEGAGEDLLQLLPNFEQAVIPIEKLRNYSLNPNHETGRHKAAVFKNMLGFEERHADVLAELIRKTLSQAPSERDKLDEHGERWTTYHPIVGLNGLTVVVTVAWIFRKERSDIPELISCYIEPEDQQRLLRLVGLG